MNFSSILNQIEQLDPEVYERTSQRRDVIKNWTRNVSLTALPFALGSLFSKAYGKGTDIIIDTLNFALTLENLESEFFKQGVANAVSIGIPSGAPLAAITTIRDHEAEHVIFLKNTITALGGQPVTFTAASFDFSGGSYSGGPGNGNGPFKNALINDYALFLAVSQTFEDTGVRAYKGQAPNLMSNNEVLTAALRIHSVEARHASHIRQMRRNSGQAPTLKPWITRDQSGINNPAVQPSYNGEDVTMQAGVSIINIGGQTISADAASESFDEPLTKADVLAIVDPFIV